MANHCIAIDAMGGDFGPRIIIPAVLQFLRQYEEASVCLIGDENTLQSYLKPSSLSSRISLIASSNVIAMDDLPVQALRHKKQSSTHLAVEQVKQCRAAACISAGNTGALMAICKRKLGMIEGVDRPAICGALPTMAGHSYLLDMGANVDCNAHHLLQFALMASAMAAALNNKARPSVALLNNGEEDSKGNHQVKQAAQLLSEHADVHYIGYVEGHQVFDALADIIVCDGFVGNIALKTAEGVASYMLQKIRQEMRRDLLSRCLSLFAWPALYRAGHSIDPRRFNGAILLGVQGVVVKSHGHADQKAFFYALEKTYRLVTSDMLGRLQQTFLFNHQ